MSVSPEQSFRPSSRRRVSWPDSWVKDQALRHVVFKMRRQSLSETPPPELFETIIEDLDSESSSIDFTSLLSDELLLLVLSKLPESQHIPDSAVCKRWLRLSGRLVHSIKLLDWEFLESGRLLYRFPNLTDIDLVRSCLKSIHNSGIVVTNKFVSIYLDSCLLEGGFMQKHDLLDSGVIDRGVRILAQGCPNLRRLVIIGASAQGLSCVAEECLTLQELELHCCPDSSLSGIFGCQNLQILKLIGFVDGFYDSVISDIGLTIVAQGCKRLVKLELVGCEGSYDGIKAIGQCCQMLEELTLCDHRMDGGWLAALSYCMNLKTLKLKSCKNIDLSPGPDEHLGSCPALEELHLQRCQMRDKQGMRALFLVCEAVRELIFKDCFGLENNVFGIASICRRVRFLSLEGCSLLTMEGLDAVVLSWKELQRLNVVSCNNIKDSEITPAMASLFSVLKALKWQPDSRSLLASGLEGTGLGMKGGRSFKGVAVGEKYRVGNGFHVIAAHTDSPCLKLKPKSASSKSSYLMVNVQTYGGGLWHTWFDRDLSLAGRVIVRDKDGSFLHKLVKVERPLLRVPTLAIHLDRTVNKDGFKPNLETHLIPLLATKVEKTSLESKEKSNITKAAHHPLLMQVLSDELSCGIEDIANIELNVCDTQPSCLGGANNEFIFSGRLDNLASSYCALRALIDSCETPTDLSSEHAIRMIALFDNEEVGSNSIQGAGAPTVFQAMRRIVGCLAHEYVGEGAYERAIRQSFLVSADMAHGVHPNFMDKHEEHHRPELQKGLVIKYNANQRYATSGVTAFLFKEIAKIHNLPTQEFAVRNDMGCGSTIGPILASGVGIRTVDCGIAQLSMHSIREICGKEDVDIAYKHFKAFYQTFSSIDRKLNVD